MSWLEKVLGPGPQPETFPDATADVAVILNPWICEKRQGWEWEIDAPARKHIEGRWMPLSHSRPSGHYRGGTAKDAELKALTVARRNGYNITKTTIVESVTEYEPYYD